jgi:hypothetical protein
MNPKRRGRNLLISLCVAWALALTGCSKSAPVYKAGPPPTGPTMLKLKWPVGSRVETTVDLRQPMETKMPGQSEPQKQELLVTQKYVHTVLSESPDGSHVLEMEFVGTKVSMKGDTTSVELDTSDKALESTPTGATAHKLMGAKVQIFLDASNEVQKIEGEDELKKLIGPVKKNDPMEMLTDLTSEDTFRNLMQAGKSLPGTPVQPGDSWPVKTESHSRSMGTLISDHTYTFKGWERQKDHNVAHLEFDGTTASKAGQDLRISGLAAIIEGGKSSGEAWFDLEEGMFVEATVTQDLTVTLTMPKQAGGQQLVVSLNQFITVKAERTR